MFILAVGLFHMSNLIYVAFCFLRWPVKINSWPPAEALNIKEEHWQGVLPEHFHAQSSCFQSWGPNPEI